MTSFKPVFVTAIFAVLLLPLVGCNNKESDMMRQLFNLETTNQFYITLPDQKSEVLISEFIKNNDKTFAKGTLEGDTNYSVLLDHRNMMALNSSDDKITRLVAPYTISNGAVKSSEIDKLNLPSTSSYLGLFELNNKTYAINQTDSQLVGVNITIKNISYDGQKNVQLKFRSNTTENKPSNIETASFDIDKSITPIILEIE